MIQVWKSYRCDLGRAYPMFALSVQQINEMPSEIDPILLLPPAIASQIIEVGVACTIAGLTPRTLVLYLSDGAIFKVSYPQPFSDALFDYLTLNSEIAAFEFVGERLKYGRLRKLLDYVQF